MPIYLQVISGPLSGFIISLEEGEKLTIGRSLAADLPFPADQAISSNHATFEKYKGHFYITDHGSSNGSFLEGRMLASDSKTKISDFCVIGTTVLKLVSLAEMPLENQPVTLSHQVASSWRKYDMFEQAMRAAVDEGSSYISGIHFLQAIINIEEHAVQNICLFQGMNFDELKQRLEQKTFFYDGFAWLNQFFSFKTQRKTLDLIVTPEAQRIMVELSQMEKPSTIDALSYLLGGPFNSISALFDPDNQFKLPDEEFDQLSEIHRESPQKTGSLPKPDPVSDAVVEEQLPASVEGKGVELGLDSNFHREMEDLLKSYIKSQFKFSLRYSDRSGSISKKTRVSKQDKIFELQSQYVALFAAFNKGFAVWYSELIKQIAPTTILKEVGVNSPRKNWKLYMEKFETLDLGYAEDSFQQILGKIFQEQLDLQKKP